MSRLTLLIITLLMVESVFVQAQDFDEIIEEMKLHAYTDYEKMKELGERGLEMAGDDKAMQAKVLLEYGNHFYYEGNYTQADSVFDIVLSLANKGKDVELANKATLRHTVIMAETGKHRKAEERLRDHIKEFTNENDIYNLIDAYNSLAQIKIDHEVKIDSGLYFYNLALIKAKEIGSEYQQGYLLNNIGLLRLNMGEVDEALEKFKLAYTYASNAKQLRLEAHIANNLGLIYMKRKEYDESEKYFREFMRNSEKAGAGKELGVAYINLGTICFAREEYEIGKVYYDSALYHFDRINAIRFIPRAMNAVSRHLVTAGHFQKAIEYADSSLLMSEEHQLLEDHILSHRLLARIYDSIGDYRQSIHYHKLVISLSDSMQQMKYDKDMADMAVKYDLQGKEDSLTVERSQNEALKKDAELDQFRVRVLTGIGLGLPLVVFLIMYLRHVRIARRKQREYSKKLLQNVEDERSRIAKELHDDLGQRLSIVRNRIDVGTTFSKEETEEIGSSLEEAVESTRKMARSLYPSYLRKVDLTQALESLMNSTEKTTELTCSYEIDLNLVEVGELSKLHVFRIVQECISNTLKHAEATAIKLSLRGRGDRLELEYRDNGKGIQKKEELDGMGMMSIAERTRILNGEMTVSPPKGKGFLIAMKLDSNADTNS